MGFGDARRAKSNQALALRCQIVPACAEGASNVEAATRLGMSQTTISRIWRSLGSSPPDRHFKLSTDATLDLSITKRETP